MYSDFTILNGSRNSGRSSLLFLIADIFKSNGKICFFLGATSEFDLDSNNSINLNSYAIDIRFDRKFFYRNKDIRLIENIVDISKRENCDYIFIDDIDHLPKETINILYNSPSKKVCTSLIPITSTNLPDSIDISNYLLESKYDDSTLSEEKYIIHNETKTILRDFIKSMERDQKINSILK